MTERYHSLCVVLENDIRDDDAEYLINAIRMLRGVLEVKPNVANMVTLTSDQRARFEVRRRLYKALDD